MCNHFSCLHSRTVLPDFPTPCRAQATDSLLPITSVLNKLVDGMPAVS